jgi:hypothetical protein
MAKRLLLSVLLIPLLGAYLPVPSSAQEEVHSDIPQAVIETLDGEPPLSQADIDAYIKIMPELTRLLNDPQSAEQLAASLNLSQSRFSYIVAKVGLTMALASGADPKMLGLDSLPKALHPSDRELRLVKDNLEALIAPAEEAYRALTENLPGATANEP